jgi:hypothetical protein
MNMDIVQHAEQILMVVQYGNTSTLRQDQKQRQIKLLSYTELLVPVVTGVELLGYTAWN